MAYLAGTSAHDPYSVLKEELLMVGELYWQEILRRYVKHGPFLYYYLAHKQLKLKLNSSFFSFILALLPIRDLMNFNCHIA